MNAPRTETGNASLRRSQTTCRLESAPRCAEYHVTIDHPNFLMLTTLISSDSNLPLLDGSMIPESNLSSGGCTLKTAERPIYTPRPKATVAEGGLIAASVSFWEAPHQAGPATSCHCRRAVVRLPDQRVVTVAKPVAQSQQKVRETLIYSPGAARPRACL